MVFGRHCLIKRASLTFERQLSNYHAWDDQVIIFHDACLIHSALCAATDHDRESQASVGTAKTSPLL